MRRGQVIKRGGDTWLVRLPLGRDRAGKRLYFNQTVHGRRQDAERVLTAKQREQDLGALVAETSLTVNEFLDQWLSSAMKARVPCVAALPVHEIPRTAATADAPVTPSAETLFLQGRIALWSPVRDTSISAPSTVNDALLVAI
jgi:hypothetical protein